MPRTGRPRSLTRKVTITRRDGEEVTDTIANLICAEIRATGLQPRMAAAAVNVSPDQCGKWLNYGKHVDAEVQKGHYVTAGDLVARDFWLATIAAKHQWIAERADLHAQISKGGLLVTEITERISPSEFERDEKGEVVLDGNGKPKPLVLERRVKQSRTLPSAAGIEWELARLAKQEGFAERVELTGDQGGPVQVEVESDADRARRLSAEIQAFLTGVDDGREIEREASDAEEAVAAGTGEEADPPNGG